MDIHAVFEDAKDAVAKARRALEEAQRNVLKAREEAKQAIENRDRLGADFEGKTRHLATRLQEDAPQEVAESASWITLKANRTRFPGDLWGVDWSYKEDNDAVTVRVSLPIGGDAFSASVVGDSLQIRDAKSNLWFYVQLGRRCCAESKVHSNGGDKVEFQLVLETNSMEFVPWAKFLDMPDREPAFATHTSLPFSVMFTLNSENLLKEYAVKSTLSASYTISQFAEACPVKDQEDEHYCCVCKPCDSDYIGLYREGELAVSKHYNVTFLDGRLEGGVDMSLPSIPGRYQLGYVHHSGKILGASEAFAISASTTPSSILVPDSLELEKNRKCSSHETPEATSMVAVGTKHAAHVDDTGALCPTFLVERLPAISVYLVVLQLPSWVSWSAFPACGKMVLPAAWRPGLCITQQGGSSIVDIEYQLPEKEGTVLSLYRLTLHIPHLLDEHKATCIRGEDNISVRLPIMYTGSMVTNRRPALIQQAEVFALRQPGVRLSCKLCRQTLWLSSELPSAYVLPSEDWVEWSDFWMCHPDEKNICVPAKEYGAMKDASLIGESCIQVHPANIQADGMLSRSNGFYECRRCHAVVGQMRNQERFDRSVIGTLPAQLSLAEDPVMLLYKSALFLPKAETADKVVNVYQHFPPYLHIASQLLVMSATYSTMAVDVVYVADRGVGARICKVWMLSTNTGACWQAKPGAPLTFVPCIKLRFMLDDSVPSGIGTGATSDVKACKTQWDSLVHTLHQTSLLLPPSARRMGDWAVGFLPLTESTNI